MDSKTIRDISQQIYRRFPEVSGAAPNVKSQPDAKGIGNGSAYLLTFKGRVQSNGGPAFNRNVRVVASGDGRILKVTTSR